ncbi:hypothetical protein KFE25_001114 [Diacronema lutheri]|uniref:BSD domain-containing protein n=1 Tax=Diacronema lutheri TaxID=2081491 RepID=A0A8J6C9E6_DIALT|nr:hypothetical protein KFE25_001114 [Diacronema lutheri]
MGQTASASASNAEPVDLSSPLDAHSELWVGVPEQIQWLVARKLLLLSAADGVLLRTRHGEDAFAADVPSAVAQSTISPTLAAAALQFDPQLQSVRDRLVRPRKKANARWRAPDGPFAMTDQLFWSNYVSHVDAIKHELTLDFFRALQALHNRNQRLRAAWIAQWEGLAAEDRAHLRRSADGIAHAVAALGGEVDDGEASEYGERGAYEVVRVVLAAALARGWRVSGAAGPADGELHGAGAAEAPPGAERPFEELLYRVWCCTDPLLPPPHAGAQAAQSTPSPTRQPHERMQMQMGRAADPPTEQKSPAGVARGAASPRAWRRSSAGGAPGNRAAHGAGADVGRSDVGSRRSLPES